MFARSERPGRADQVGGMPYALIAVVSWGVVPLFWPLLEPAGPLEILMQRIVWSFLFVALLMTVIRGWSRMRGLGRRTWGLLFVAGLLNGVNWGLYIFAVTTGHIVDAALGYFMNPLMSAAMGVIVLKEQLRRVQWVALGVGLVAVLLIGISTGVVPWLPITMSVCFGFYALTKRVIPMKPVDSLTGESFVLVPVALVFLIVFHVSGESTFLDNGISHVVLLATGGLVTLLPLLAFSVAAQRLKLSTLGLMMYIAPILQFLIGVFWAREAMPPGRWFGFGLIVLALAVFSLDAVRGVIRARRLRAD